MKSQSYGFLPGIYNSSIVLPIQVQFSDGVILNDEECSLITQLTFYFYQVF